MDQFVKKQIEIHLKKESILKSYPRLWKKMLSEWSTPESYNRGWLLYSANYLFHTVGIRWAIDPIRLNWRVADVPQVDYSPLADLDFILLTHHHYDHLDLELLKSLEKYPITWIIPKFLLDLLCEEGITPKKIIIPNSKDSISLDGLTLTPFDGIHWHVNTSLDSDHLGVPSMGYLVEFNGNSWLFPGDVRTYNPDGLSFFGPVDVLFAHLWLGRGCALQEKPALLDNFCLFCLSSQPKRIIVTHIEEFGRQPDDFWEARHFDLVAEWFRRHAPNIQVKSAKMGEAIILKENN